MRVTVIGEYCTDVFIYGDVKRLSPEAPVPVFTPLEKTNNPGMAGNVVNNLTSIDPTINVFGKYQSKIITKTRYVDKKTNHMFIRIDENDETEKINVNQSVTNLIMNSDLIIVSDYDKGYLSIDDLKLIGQISRMSILDSKKILTKEVVSSYTFVKLNELEYKQNEHLHNCNNIIVTLGSKGCMFNGKIFDSPKPLETIDVSGAGDTFTASFILEYFKTKDIEKSLKFANLMSSIVVSKRGVVTP